MKAIGAVLALSLRGAIALVVGTAIVCVIVVFLIVGWLMTDDIETK